MCLRGMQPLGVSPCVNMDIWQQRLNGSPSIMRRDTALALIDPDAYAIAETSCDGNPSAIAEELEVTKQVIEDWRNLLHDGMLPPPRR